MSENVADVRIRLSIWDRAGIWFSGICMVHCLALPVMLIAIPLWPALALAHGWVHPLFALILLVTTLPAAHGAWKRHGSLRLAVLLMSGLAVVLLALVAGRSAGIYVEDGLTLLGSGMLIAGHWKNGRACAHRHCTHPH